MQSDDAIPPLVLVVDDLEDLVVTLIQMIEMRGYRADGAYDGWQGLQKARRLLPDVVVLDHKMPVLSGCEVGTALKSHPTTAHIKIVMHTAVDEGVIAQLFADYDRFHPKSHNPLALLATIEELAGPIPRGSH